MILALGVYIMIAAHILTMASTKSQRNKDSSTTVAVAPAVTGLNVALHNEASTERVTILKARENDEPAGNQGRD